ncbi:pyridoxamine 5'-phosphate oxidase family protein [Pseudonocardia sp. HH130630-07]|uniref:pyridoxamine 5'-phosphate oxidase family protein n=1 Tax=Pseudonocardia sp. HH130630-07 TaxID=1690815 RepID=UPI000814D8C8|nr:pyridoxamine 5'-phosphate oxidase family protein [Pseudonocardia sp. HH130630-07]ANY09726.1 pyridoxamine 5'-phosphate oxidase [Pseudonocardia sp. HH130630-07]
MSTTDSLTTDDLEFLARPLHGFLTVAGSAQPPQPRPVWFEATEEGTIRLFTPAGSPKLRHLRRDPRASIVVAAPADERERWIAVSGPVTEEPDDTTELRLRLAARYWDLDERSGDLPALLDEEQVRLVIHPEKVRRFAF